jgi:hypothetical protein
MAETKIATPQKPSEEGLSCIWLVMCYATIVAKKLPVANQKAMVDIITTATAIIVEKYDTGLIWPMYPSIAYLTI